MGPQSVRETKAEYHLETPRSSAKPYRFGVSELRLIFELSPVILLVAFSQPWAVNRCNGTAATACVQEIPVKKMLFTFGAAIFAITMLMPVTAAAQTHHHKRHHKHHHHQHA
jgi:hypothetical protein